MIRLVTCWVMCLAITQKKKNTNILELKSNFKNLQIQFNDKNINSYHLFEKWKCSPHYSVKDVQSRGKLHEYFGALKHQLFDSCKLKFGAIKSTRKK